MTFEEAKTLQVGDEVIVKESRKIIHITEVYDVNEENQEVIFRCNDGRPYDNEFFCYGELTTMKKVTNTFFADHATAIAVKRYLRTKRDGYGWNIAWAFSIRPDNSGVDFRLNCRKDQAAEIEHFLVRRAY